MSAVIARHAQAAPIRSLPATPVIPLEEPAQMAAMFGLQLLQTHSGLFYPFIDAGDVIEVDFDVRRIAYDSEFLISIADEEGGEWFGARRFQFRLDGQLWIADPDGHSGVTWHAVSSKMLNSITVYGEVREVYKPVSKLRRASV